MSWYLRKSLRFGPLRINLSKSGIGASVGVKGLRTGVDAGGKTYVAGGRGGLYFRKRLPEGADQVSAPTSSARWAVWLIIAALVVVALVVTR